MPDKYRLTHNETIEVLTWFIAGAYDKEIDGVAEWVGMRATQERNELLTYFGLHSWDRRDSGIPPLIREPTGD